MHWTDEKIECSVYIEKRIALEMSFHVIGPTFIKEAIWSRQTKNVLLRLEDSRQLYKACMIPDSAC